MLRVEVRVPTNSQLVSNLAHHDALLGVSGPLLNRLFCVPPNELSYLLFSELLRLSH